MEEVAGSLGGSCGWLLCVGEPPHEGLVTHLDVGDSADFAGDRRPRVEPAPLGDQLRERAVLQALFDRPVQRALALLDHAISVALAIECVNAPYLVRSATSRERRHLSGIANFVAHRHTQCMTANTGERDERDVAYPQGAGDIPADTFALRLVASRHHAGRLSIEQAASRCLKNDGEPLNAGNWANWEAGVRPRDKVEVARAVAEGLGMNFNWLLLGGPLLPARGRPVRKSRTITGTYCRPTIRSAEVRVIGRGPNVLPSPAQPVRQRRVIDRSHPVAV